MTNLVVSGCYGTMGQILCRMIDKEPDMQVVCGIDPKKDSTIKYPFEVYPELEVFDEAASVLEDVDVIIDFSSGDAVDSLLNLVLAGRIPAVIATTKIPEETMKKMQEISEQIPIFYSANMSYDICALRHTLKTVVPMMGDTVDIEITEEHHNRKADSPSGTALLLANTINECFGGSKKIVYGRTDKRQPNEIGISSVRGGNLCGIHTVKFFGPNDVLEIKHTALSRDVFAEGAIRAAKFITQDGIYPGLYGMDDLI